MHLKDNFFYTLREVNKDNECKSSILLQKAGLIKQTSAGIFIYMPMFLRVCKKIEDIIREEMIKIGSQEMMMPMLIASKYYEDSGRLSNFGSSVYRLKDRNQNSLILGPTHEELFAYAAKSMIKSYKQLPFSLFQIQTKFRDEPRARFGLIRLKEFVMKDAYSFDKDLEGLNTSYNKMFEAYKNIFNRLGINYRIVKADTGIMGGMLSEEFQAISEIGEDTLVYSKECDYSANLEIASINYDYYPKTNEAEEALEKVLTEGKETIAEVSTYLNKKPSNCLKALVYFVDNKPAIFLLRGDRTLNETKVLKYFNASEIRAASNDEISSLGLIKGYIGPINQKLDCYADNEIKYLKNMVSGANEKDYHYLNTNLKDFTVKDYFDLRFPEEDDLCPEDGSKLYFTKGIEIGNTFKLGTKYSKAVNLYYQDENNQNQDVYLGSYGIGISRCIAALIEQSPYEDRLVWPKEIAPYLVNIIIMNTKDNLQLEIANKLYQSLNKYYDCVIDDRDERAGVKLNDHDLIGYPYRIIVGKKAINNTIELKMYDGESIDLNVDDLINDHSKYINKK